jgi:hypothetical protein
MSELNLECRMDEELEVTCEGVERVMELLYAEDLVIICVTEKLLKMQENLRRTGLTVWKRPVHGQTYPTVHGQKCEKSNHLAEINLVPNLCQEEIGSLLLLVVQMEYFHLRSCSDPQTINRIVSLHFV